MVVPSKLVLGLLKIYWFKDLFPRGWGVLYTNTSYEWITGFTLQVRTSYLPNEILWGYRFEHSCVSYDKQEAKYAVSITNLNKIKPDNTPRYDSEYN